MTIASKSVRRSYYYYYYPYYYYYKEKERKVNFRTRFFLMLANEFLAFEHSPLFFVDIIIHCSLLRTCRVRVEEKEEFLVYTVLWTLTCHPYLESATALSDNRPNIICIDEHGKYRLLDDDKNTVEHVVPQSSCIIDFKSTVDNM